MHVNKMAGWCLILLGIVNVLHEITLRTSGRGAPGLAYAIVTALMFTFGFVLLWRKRAEQKEARSKVKGPSILQD